MARWMSTLVVGAMALAITIGCARDGASSAASSGAATPAAEPPTAGDPAPAGQEGTQ